MTYLLHILIMITIYIILAQSLTLTAGWAGLISLAHAGFYGIGAYTTAILSTQYGFVFWQTCPLAMLYSGMVAVIVSTIALRTAEDYFVICTLGIQMILFAVMNNWMELTQGPLGITGIPAIALGHFKLDQPGSFLGLSTLLCLLVFGLLRNLSTSAFGRVLRALKEDEIFTQSLGKNVYQAKVIAFTIGAMLAAIAGVLYAHYISFIDPTSFTIDESIFILSVVIMGGLGSLWGAALAAIVMVCLPEALRFVGLPNNIAANLRQMLYGAILVGLMMVQRKK